MSTAVELIEVSLLKPSPENEAVYNINEIETLAKSIAAHGLLEPLVITQDYFVISGHRRLQACKQLGLQQLPCIVERFHRQHIDTNDYLKLLREYNRQRIKNINELAKECLIDLDPENVYQEFIARRDQRDPHQLEACCQITGPALRRAKISLAKQPMLQAVLQVLEARRDYLPTTDRAIHYALLNHPPLRNANRLESTYCNDAKSYKDLCDLLTRARLMGAISFAAIIDETRPTATNSGYNHVQEFIDQETRSFLQSYRRDLLQTQPAHLEVICEKQTLLSVVKEVTQHYCLPYTIGRGYCSLYPRYQICQRFQQSTKKQLVLLILSDYDPDGLEIANSFSKSLRDDFGISESQLQARRVALTKEQITKYKLPQAMEAKKSSSNYDEFVKQTGANAAFELEALAPDILADILQDAINQAIDLELFQQEQAREKEECLQLTKFKKTIPQTLIRTSPNV